MRWGMLINLVKCVGCHSCVVKCKQEHLLHAKCGSCLKRTRFTFS